MSNRPDADAAADDTRGGRHAARKLLIFDSLRTAVAGPTLPLANAPPDSGPA